MDFKVKQDTYNPLLKRKELAVEVEHENAGSPSRMSLREAVAAKYSTKLDNVFVFEIETRTGSQSAICEIQVYDDAETAKKIVPKYIQIRNLPTEERKKLKEASKKAEEKAKPGKPKAEKPKTEEKPKAEKPKMEEKPTEKPKTEEQTKPEKTGTKEQKGAESKPADAGKGKGIKPKEAVTK
jgi:ribosomal protein S24E